MANAERRRTPIFRVWRFCFFFWGGGRATEWEDTSVMIIHDRYPCNGRKSRVRYIVGRGGGVASHRLTQTDSKVSQNSLATFSTSPFKVSCGIKNSWGPRTRSKSFSLRSDSENRSPICATRVLYGHMSVLKQYSLGRVTFLTQLTCQYSHHVSVLASRASICGCIRITCQ